MIASQVLARKWRPKNFHEVVGQDHVVRSLVNGLDRQRLHHAFLFTGTRGVGKTTLARILAKSLNCEQGVSSTPCGVCSICQEVDQGRFVDLIEIDAASRTKVEDTREILDNVQYAPTRGRTKVYLIDEVHMLSNSSFNALLKTLEEPPAHVKFLLATTDPQKLPVTVLSRCLRFHLKKIHVDVICQQLARLMDVEQIPYDIAALRLLASAGQGSMRDALSLLDQAIAYTGGRLTTTDVTEMLGTIDDQHVLSMLVAIASFNAASVLVLTRQFCSLGLDFTRLLEALITGLHQLSIMKIDIELVNFDQSEQKIQWVKLSEQLEHPDLQLFYQIALHGRQELNLHPEPSIGFEMTLLRMILLRPLQIAARPAILPKLDLAHSPSLTQATSELATHSLVDNISTISPQMLSTTALNSEAKQLASIQSAEPLPTITKQPDQFEVNLDQKDQKKNCQTNEKVVSPALTSSLEEDEMSAIYEHYVHSLAEFTQISTTAGQSVEIVSNQQDCQILAQVPPNSSHHTHSSTETRVAPFELNDSLSESTAVQTEYWLNSTRWTELITQLVFSAKEQALAAYLAFVAFDPAQQQLSLNIEAKFAPLLTEQVINVIQEALCGYLDTSLTIQVQTVGYVEEEAYLVGQTARLSMQKRQEMLQAFNNDPLLQQLLRHVDGVLCEERLQLFV